MDRSSGVFNLYGSNSLKFALGSQITHAQTTRSALDIDFTELEEGDYVVHLQHGIGRYIGPAGAPPRAGTKPTEGTAATANAGQECLVIEYAPGDPAQPPPKLYVPVTEAHLVSKYVGAGKARPPLNTLGGHALGQGQGAGRTGRARCRQRLAGHPGRARIAAGPCFLAGHAWQREFESAFVFEETPDQMRAIVETKADMERAKPMDRLICGDVGFGKTEVAIRAAFKAVMDGKQVAVLVPTTVLAQQHFNTFRERMADYPVRLELLSRFRTPARQQRGGAGPGRRRGGHRDRHAPAVAGGRGVQGPGPGGHRRGAAVRRDAQGEIQDAAQAGGRADAQRHADPAHALSGADRARGT